MPLSATLALGVLAVQALCFLGLALSILAGRTPGELITGKLVRLTYVVAFVLSILASLALVISGEEQAVLSLGEWQMVGTYEFHAVLMIDSLCIPFLLLATLLCGIVATFSEKYLHREPGYHRFFLLLCLFGFGDCLTILSGSIETLYASWETLGLTSALLIGFFHERSGPVQNGLYTFIVYRISDLCLALAAVTVYHLARTGDFASFLGSAPWPDHSCQLTPAGAMTVGLLILVAALGKAAQLPFSGWLRRAMEGPTPSTAIFYGALSVHAGAFLLLRCSSLLDASPPVAAATFTLGLCTAFWARAVGVTQTDVKCSLAYASMVQVGLIFAEIGLGFRILPVVHVVSHALIRSIQFLRAPSLLHEIHEQSSAVGRRPAHRNVYEGWMKEPRNYKLSAELFHLETLLHITLVGPFLAFCQQLLRWDRMTLDFLFGKEEGPLEP